MSTPTPQPADLSTAIRESLELPFLCIRWDDETQQDHTNAILRVLDECDRCERGGTFMAPQIVRDLIARELGVTQ